MLINGDYCLRLQLEFGAGDFERCEKANCRKTIKAGVKSRRQCFSTLGLSVCPTKHPCIY